MFYAVDFATPEGTPIVAAADGVVAAITWEVGLPLSKNLGDALVLYLDHGNGWFTRYVHLSGVTVSVGDQIEQGDVIGYAGHTGAEGAHLHFELKQGAQLHAPSQPIDELFGGQPPEVGQTYLAAALPLDPTPTPSMARATPTPTALFPSSAGLTTSLVLPVSPTVSHTPLMAGEPFTVTLTLANVGAQTIRLPIVGMMARQNGVFVQNGLAFTQDVVLAPNETRSVSLSLAFPAGTYLLSPFAFSETYTLVPLGIAETRTPTLTVTINRQNAYLPLVWR